MLDNLKQASAMPVARPQIANELDVLGSTISTTEKFVMELAERIYVATSPRPCDEDGQKNAPEPVRARAVGRGYSRPTTAAGADEHSTTAPHGLDRTALRPGHSAESRAGLRGKQKREAKDG